MEKFSFHPNNFTFTPTNIFFLPILSFHHLTSPCKPEYLGKRDLECKIHNQTDITAEKARESVPEG
jgi:hypothetical protein